VVPRSLRKRTRMSLLRAVHSMVSQVVSER
jgi:hypothetical protein